MWLIDVDRVLNQDHQPLIGSTASTCWLVCLHRLHRHSVEQSVESTGWIDAWGRGDSIVGVGVERCRILGEEEPGLISS